MSIIRAKNIIKNFSRSNTVTRVIDDISLETVEGEFLAITGASGSGKSTLLYLISGLLEPSQGTVLLNNVDLYRLKEKELAKIRRSDISFIYQFYNLIPNLTIYENIVLPIRMERKLNPDDIKYLYELLDTAGIRHIVDRTPDEVSGGEQQRAALIRALFIRPKIIFADEPTGNLDTKSSKTVSELIHKINKEYKTSVIMVTHSIEQASLADRMIVIEDGKIKVN